MRCFSALIASKNVLVTLNDRRLGVDVDGDPEFSDSGYNPGSIAGGVGRDPVRGKKDIDDWDDLFDEDGAEMFEQLSQSPELINSLIEEFNKNNDSEPTLSKSSSESIQKDIESTQHQGMTFFLVRLPDGTYARYIKESDNDNFKGDTIPFLQAEIYMKDQTPVFNSIPNGIKISD